MASEAKPSTHPLHDGGLRAAEALDGFVASLLAMTEAYDSKRRAGLAFARRSR